MVAEIGGGDGIACQRRLEDPAGEVRQGPGRTRCAAVVHLASSGAQLVWTLVTYSLPSGSRVTVTSSRPVPSAVVKVTTEPLARPGT